MAEKDLLKRYPKANRNLQGRSLATAEDKRIACLFGQEYFDGPRIQGYGGYKYDGRWLAVAETFVEEWNLKSGDRVLDIGCAKGFFMRDLMQVCPGLDVYGVDISQYAIENCDPAVKGRVQVANATSLPFPDKSFRAAISINTLHNLDRAECVVALKEMVRVAPELQYVQVDSYRTPEQREIFINWVLTAKTHDYPQEWLKIFEAANYKGDYYWTIIE